MLNKITTDFEVLELMIIFWETVKSREKMAESYIIDVANREQMKPLYADDFTTDSVRRVLSAISNKELVNTPTKKESKFWSNNMWMLEDMENMKNMIAPIKTLNLDHLKEELGNSSKFDEIEVIFIPGHIDTYYMSGNKLYINFFKMIATVDMETFEYGELKIEDVPFKEYVENKVKELATK